mgnify:CR=1 FL=1|jgi:molecular chaperone IbpA
MFDLTPFYRTTVGFDRLFSLLDALTEDQSLSSPPYNIEKTGEDRYRVTVAVPGWTPEMLSVETRDNELIISGTRQESRENTEGWLYRGIADGSFRRTFRLAEFVEVVGAELNNGLLHVDLVRELPEEMKPRQIEIRTSAPARIAHKARKLIEKVKDAA